MGVFPKLTVLLVVLALPPPLCLAFWLIDASAAAMLRDANSYHQLTAEKAADDVRREFDQVAAELQSVGWVIMAPDLGDDRSRLKSVQALLATSSHLKLLVLYGPEGQRLWTVHDPAVPADWPPELPTGLRGSRAHPLTPGRVVGPPEAPVLEVGLALFSSAEASTPNAWLLTQLELAPVSRRVAQLGARPPLQNPDAVKVVDARHRLVVGADQRAIAEGRAGATDALFDAVGLHGDLHAPMTVTTEYIERGRPMLGALSVLPEYGLAVVVERPADEAFASLGHLRRLAAAAVALTLLAAVLVAVVVARRVTRPIHRLVEATRELAQRTFRAVSPEVVERSDELGGLGRAFDAMAGSLRTAEAEVVAESARRAALSRYLSAGVVEEVLKDPGAWRLVGERREVTVLFADVVDFTRLAESMPPETIVALLNEFFTFATEIVQRQGGIIDKFLGDCVMAVWGAPTNHPDDVLRAVEAAEELRRWVEGGNRRWRAQWGVEVQVAIGVHTGSAVAGNVGSEKRLDYTVIGDTVNIAARLESSARPGQILVSGEVEAALAGALGELPFLGEQVLRGRMTSTRIYEVPA